MTYRLTNLAKEDLSAIWTYTVNEWSESQAEIYLLELETRFMFLAENAFVGKMRIDLSEDVYSYQQGQHVIFYRRPHQVLEVLRILHASMDHENHEIY